MSMCGRSWPVNVVILLAATALFSGCASSAFLRGHPRTPNDAIHAYLDRFNSWRSLSARMKLSIEVGDVDLAAKGHLMYLLGERYEIGFTRPYSRYLGNFYVTPEQFIYWDPQGMPLIFTARDTVFLAQMIPLGLPNWDPRDLLPFPVSGRTGGFRTDSVWTSGAGAYASGTSADSRHLLTFSGGRGVLEEERVTRAGRDPIIKRYDRIRMIHGWPVATRVRCTHPDGGVAFSWSLSDVSLDAEEFKSDESRSDAPRAGTGHGG